MKRKKKYVGRRVGAVLLAVSMVMTMPSQMTVMAATTKTTSSTFDNPVIYSDVPDIDIIRVGKNYYMVSTTMHLSPGCPIMKSTDLVNWEIVNYVYNILDDEDEESLRNGKNMYGNGQWASSLQYHDGKYYVVFNSNTTGRAYICTTKDIEKGSWTRTELDSAYHDVALFFDDDIPYLIYGGGAIKYKELKKDMSGVKSDGKSGTLFSYGSDLGLSGGLNYEGTHVMKKDGYYYVFNICWPSGHPRIEVCHRSKTFPSTEWEGKIILDTYFSNNGVTAGVAQGGVIDTEDGDWYGYLFQDHGAVGRTPVLTQCTWIDGWPMLGKDGDGKTVDKTMTIPVSGGKSKTIVKSDEFYNDLEHRIFDAADEDGETKEEILKQIRELSKKEMTSEIEEESEYEESEDSSENIENSSEEKLPTLSGSVGDEKEAKADIDKDEKKEKSKEETEDESEKESKEETEDESEKESEDESEKESEGESEKESEGESEEESEDETEEESEGETEEETEDETEEESETETEETETDAEQLGLEDDILKDIEKAGSKKKLADNMVELIKNGDFETGNADNWQIMRAEQGGKIEAVKVDFADGDYCGYVSERKSCGAGACYNLSGKLVKGKTYKVSGKLLYTTGPETKNFNVTIENGDNYNWREDFLHFTAKKGEWVEFSGEYTAHDKSEKFPFDETQNYIFVETPWTASPSEENDLMSYYLDDFSVSTETDEIIINGSFEDGMKGWSGNEGAKVSVVDDEAKDGEKSAFTTDRTGTGQGPVQDLSNKLKAGATYKLEAYIKYTEGVDSQKFYATIQNGPNYTYRTNLGSTVAKKGEWSKIEATFDMPEDAILDENYLFFETPWVPNPQKDSDWVDFYVDNVSLVKTKDADVKESVKRGENDYNGSDLDLVWQWNHNPDNTCWSLTDRDGWLRLTTANVTSSILKARNTLTQRTYGPTCSGRIKMDISHMQNGDVAGLASFSYNYGYIGVTKEKDKTYLQMVDASQNASKKKDDPSVKEKIEVEDGKNIIYLKEDFDFAGGDYVTFYYSYDGRNWNKLGESEKLSYELTHFMGSRFAIFNYATKKTGGYVDVDYFRVSDEISGESKAEQGPKASFVAPESVLGVINTPCEVKLLAEDLISDGHKQVEVSISLPKELTVKDVVFAEAVKGEATYVVEGNRLVLSITGEDVSFESEEDVVATLNCTVNQYAGTEQTMTLSADYFNVDNGSVAYDVSEAVTSIKLTKLNTKCLGKQIGYGNPIMTQEFGADPYAIVYDGRVYVYMTADDFEYDADGNVINNSFGYIKTLRVVSSADMMNWTDHGEIKVAGSDGAAKWASHSWAPAVAYKQIDGKDKFFLYFANDASGIGVLEADTPIGPWKDPIGGALITRNTPGCSGVVWCFDPAVLVDDDGEAYIYFGGGLENGKQDNPKTARVAKLGKDMISIDGEAKMIDAPCMFEDSGIFKYKNKYYYSYCSNFTSPHAAGNPGYGTICYMTSDDPMGPFTYEGEIFSNPSVWFGVGGNNHHATFVFKNQPYFIYHAQTVSKEMGVEKGYRSTHIDKMSFYKDGGIKDIKGTYKGIEQLSNQDAYTRIEGETIAWNAGVKVKDCSEKGGLYPDFNRALTQLDNGDWTSLSNVDFGSEGVGKFEANIAANKDCKVEIRVDKPDGTLIGTLAVKANDGKYEVISCDTENITGVKNVFLVFSGEGDDLLDVDYVTFKLSDGTQPEKPDEPDNPDEPEKPQKPTDSSGNRSDHSSKKHHSSSKASAQNNTVVIEDAATALAATPVKMISNEEKLSLITELQAKGIYVSSLEAIYTQLEDGSVIFKDGSAYTTDNVLILVPSTVVLSDGSMISEDNTLLAKLVADTVVLTMDMVFHKVEPEVTVVPEELQVYAPVVTRSEVETPQIVSKQVVSTQNIIKENGAGIATNLKVLTKSKNNPMPVVCGCIGIAAAVSIFFVMKRRKNK